MLRAQQVRKACALLRLPAGDDDVVRALAIIQLQMDQFAGDRRLGGRALKAEQKWLRSLEKIYAARPAWYEAHDLDKAMRAFKRTSHSKQKRPQLSAYRKRAAAAMAYGLMRKYGFKLTGHRNGQFCRLAGIFYNGDPRANCYSYCCKLLSGKLP